MTESVIVENVSIESRFSIEIHVTFLALISRRNESEKCHVYSNEKKT